MDTPPDPLQEVHELVTRASAHEPILPICERIATDAPPHAAELLHSAVGMVVALLNLVATTTGDTYENLLKNAGLGIALLIEEENGPPAPPPPAR